METVAVEWLLALARRHNGETLHLSSPCKSLLRSRHETFCILYSPVQGVGGWRRMPACLSRAAGALPALTTQVAETTRLSWQKAWFSHDNGYVSAWISHKPAPMRPSRPSHGSRCETWSCINRTKHSDYSTPYPGNQRLEASQTSNVALPLRHGQRHHITLNSRRMDGEGGLFGIIVTNESQCTRLQVLGSTSASGRSSVH